MLACIMTTMVELKVDLSLARGLRSTIVKQIVTTRGSMEKAATVLLSRKSSMPTTKKGMRRVYGEIAKYLSRYALASNDLATLDRMAFWHHWTLRQSVGVDSWEEDQLAVDGVVIDLMSQAFLPFEYPVGVSMHLVERVFLRLNTRNNDLVLDELIVPTLVACALWPFLYWTLRERGNASTPLAIASAHGALFGDLNLYEGDGDWQLRTFIGGAAEVSPGKRRLMDELADWHRALPMDVFASALQVSTNDYQYLPQHRHLPEVQAGQKLADSYLAIIDRNSGALEAREDRARRARQEYRKWQR